MIFLLKGRIIFSKCCIFYMTDYEIIIIIIYKQNTIIFSIENLIY